MLPQIGNKIQSLINNEQQKTNSNKKKKIKIKEAAMVDLFTFTDDSSTSIFIQLNQVH